MHTRCVHARGAHGHALIDGWRASRGAAAKLNGMELMGRNLKISHPNGYVPPQGTPDTYDLPEVRPLGCPWNRSRPKPPEAARRRPTPPEAAQRSLASCMVHHLIAIIVCAGSHEALWAGLV